jgi:hypothetical protein
MQPEQHFREFKKPLQVRGERGGTRTLDPMIKVTWTAACERWEGEGPRRRGPKFGPKHHGIDHNQAAGIAGWRDTLKSLHKMTA